MNTRRTQWDIPRTPQNTNLASGRGCGYIPSLGRNKFVDELISRVNYSTRARNQGPSLVRRIPISPRMEASITMEILVGAATPFGVPLDGTPGDRGSFVGVGGPEEVYRIDCEEFAKEKWLQFQ